MGRDRLLQAAIEMILDASGPADLQRRVVRLADSLRPGIGSKHSEAVGESPRHRDLRRMVTGVAVVRERLRHARVLRVRPQGLRDRLVVGVVGVGFVLRVVADLVEEGIA